VELAYAVAWPRDVINPKINRSTVCLWPDRAVQDQRGRAEEGERQVSAEPKGKPLIRAMVPSRPRNEKVDTEKKVRPDVSALTPSASTMLIFSILEGVIPIGDDTR
jgi:hypothetical protein